MDYIWNISYIDTKEKRYKKGAVYFRISYLKNEKTIRAVEIE